MCVHINSCPHQRKTDIPSNSITDLRRGKTDLQWVKSVFRLTAWYQNWIAIILPLKFYGIVIFLVKNVSQSPILPCLSFSYTRWELILEADGLIELAQDSRHNSVDLSELNHTHCKGTAILILDWANFKRMRWAKLFPSLFHARVHHLCLLWSPAAPLKEGDLQIIAACHL